MWARKNCYWLVGYKRCYCSAFCVGSLFGHVLQVILIFSTGVQQIYSFTAFKLLLKIVLFYANYSLSFQFYIFLPFSKWQDVLFFFVNPVWLHSGLKQLCCVGDGFVWSSSVTCALPSSRLCGVRLHDSQTLQSYSPGRNQSGEEKFSSNLPSVALDRRSCLFNWSNSQFI